MTKRCIYFIKDNQLRVKTIDVDWDKDAMETSKVLCRRKIEASIEDLMLPCVDVSTASLCYRGKNVSTSFVKDSNGNSIKDLWKLLDSRPDKEFLPPGSYDLIYLANLNEQQIEFALSQNGFYDMFYNPDKGVTCNAKALAVFKLLVGQGKVDFIGDMNKFLWWYWVNGRELEWISKGE